MGKPELPDTIEETNVPDQHLTFAQDLEEGKEEETPKEESQEDKPVKETSPKEDPSQNPYWQSKYDREVVAAKQEAEKLRQEIESIKSQLNPPKKDEPLVPPVPPRNDDPLEEIRYAREYAEYTNKVNEQRFGKMDAYFQTIETERQQQRQQAEIAQQRAWQVTQLAQAGLSPDEANQALADFSRDAETPDKYFKDLAEFWKFRNGQQPKTSKVEQRANRKSELPPLGVETSETETRKIDPNDEFYTDMQGFISKNY
jgi:hypothetical protein